MRIAGANKTKRKGIGHTLRLHFQTMAQGFSHVTAFRFTRYRLTHSNASRTHQFKIRPFIATG